MKSRITMMVAVAVAVGFCAAMAVRAEDAAPAKAEGKGCATCPGCPKDTGGDKKMSLGDRMMKRLEKVTPALTAEQTTKINDLVAAAEKKVAEATDPKAKGAIVKELHKSIDAVLTPEQLASLPKGKRHGGKKDKDGEATPPADTTK